MLFLLLGSPAAKADRSPPNCTGSGLGINLFTSIPDVHIGDTLFYSATVFNGLNGTGEIACDATSITAFIVTPDGKTNMLALVRTTLHQGEQDSYPDVVSYVVRAQDIQPDGTLKATARDIGVIHQNDVNSSGGGFQGVNTEVNQPCVKITAACVGGVGENGVITFSGTVVNCGNNTLVGVVVTNFVNGQAFTVLFPTNLAIGQSAPFTGSWIPANACAPSTAILTVQATDQFTSTPRTVTNIATITCQNTLTPGILVTKVCPAAVPPGQILTFSGSVSNTGNVTLTNVVVVNNQPAANTTVFTQAFLAPGQVAFFSGSYLAPTNCSVSDTLTARAATICGVPVVNSASATCPILILPQITVTANCPANPVPPGGSLTYSGTVQNSGNIALTNVVVFSSLPAANTRVFSVAILAPGATANFTSTTTVPAGGCAVTATFSGTARDVCTLTPLTNTVSTTCSVTTAAAVAVTLTCPTVTATSGGLITYSGTVRNSGNVLLNNVFVVNNQPVPNTAVIGPLTLAPGASSAFTASFTAPTDVCSVSSTVTATANDNCAGVTVTSAASANCALKTTPGIVVTEVCPASPAIPGTPLTYSGTVFNSGNIMLTNVIVLNNLSGGSPIFIATTLDAGETANFSGSYITPTNCSSTSTSTATGRSICGIAVTNRVSATCPILLSPQLAVTANCPSGPVLPGGSLIYSGTVQNTGNVTLTNVLVVSDTPAPNTRVFSVATLAPGASAHFTSASTVPAGACSITATFTGTARDVCALVPLATAVSTTCNVLTAPAIAVTLACPTTTSSAGGLITYTGTVRNSGNVTLNNVFVVNNQPNPNTSVVGPLTLAPGASSAFTATFTAPTGSCSVSSTVNASGNDNCTSVAVTAAASATCSLRTTAAIVVTETCPGGPAIPGTLLTYSGTVFNSGNVLLTNIVILNNLSGNTPIFTAATLDAGQTASFTGSYITPTNCSSTSTSTATGRSTCGIAVANTASAACAILLTPQILVTATCPATTIVPGGSLTYSGTVRNTGNIAITNVLVVSSLPVANTTVFSVAVLAPGASANFTSTATVPTGACSVTATFTGTARDVCALAPLTTAISTTCNVTTAPAIAVTLACPLATTVSGGLITYTGTVRNTGNDTLNNVFVVNNQPVPNTAVVGPLTLAPGASSTFTASFNSPSDACSVSSTVNASGNDNCTSLAVTATASATCSLGSTPSITITETCPPGLAIPGTLLTYSGTVVNSGNIALTNVVVLNNLSGGTPVFTAATLAAGQTASFTGSYITPTNCSSSSTSTVTARSTCGVAVANTASATCTILVSPQILVTATCPATVVVPGGSLTYGGTVRNTGNITLTNVVVVSSLPAANTTVFSVAFLAPGASTNFTSTTTVPIGACSVTAVFTGTGQDVCTLNPLTNSVSTTCAVTTAPAIAVTLACPATITTTGGLITYTGTVRNTGNDTLNNVFVVNNQPVPNTAVVGPLTLAPGASSTFTASFTAPSDACSVSSTVNASGNDNCTSLAVTAAASATCALGSTPSITITENCPPVPAVPGSLLNYSGTIVNTGNVTLTNVVVVNNQSGNTPVFTIASLGAGASVNYSGSYLTPTNCSTSSTSTVTGRSLCGIAVVNSASAICPIVTTPVIVVTQTCPAVAPLPGGILTYTGTVSNAGNITLTGIVVVDNRPATNTVVFTVASLAPGASTNFTGSYTVPLDCCVVWSTLDATGLGCAGQMVSDTDTHVCNVRTLPAITITKICPPNPLRPGDLLNYSGVVSNAGNISLINVTVTDNVPANGAPLLGPIDLAPGESVTYYGSYIVPADFCGNDNVVATGEDVCSFLPVTANVTTSCQIITTPRIGVTKFCPLTPTPRGGLYTFTGTVTNMGDVALINVYVVDSQPSNNTPVIGPITLAPGRSVNFSGSYIAPTCCCLILDTLTASGQGNCSGTVVTDTSTAICPLLTSPAIALVQPCPPNPIPMGSVYNFSGYVTNTGDAVLTNVFVFGPGGSPLAGPLELAPGEAQAYSGSYTIPFNTCAVAVTVSGQDICGGNFATNETSCPVANTPLLALTQNCPVGSVGPGGLFTFSGSVSNAGNITLDKILVSNDHTGSSPLLSIATLAPGAVSNFTGSYLVTTNFTTTSTSTAIGSTSCGTVVSNAASATCPTLIRVRIVSSVNVSSATNSFNLAFPTESGRSYTIEYKNSFTDPTWTVLKTVTGTGGIISLMDAIPASRPMRLYRIIYTP